MTVEEVRALGLSKGFVEIDTNGMIVNTPDLHQGIGSTYGGTFLDLWKDNMVGHWPGIHMNQVNSEIIADAGEGMVFEVGNMITGFGVQSTNSFRVSSSTNGIDWIEEYLQPEPNLWVNTTHIMSFTSRFIKLEILNGASDGYRRLYWNNDNATTLELSLIHI